MVFLKSPLELIQLVSRQYLGGRVGAEELYRTIRCSGGDVHYHPTTSRYIGVGRRYSTWRFREGGRGKEGEVRGKEGKRGRGYACGKKKDRQVYNLG